MDGIVADLGRGTSLGWYVIIVRLGGAIVFSGLIGFERESRSRPAGLRTHMLVGLASASYCIIMLEMLAISETLAPDLAMDPLRLLEAVTSGVAFLAAGMIFLSRGKIQGLTTGASLWLAAALGLGAGFGMWPIAILSTVLALVIIRLLKSAEDVAHKRRTPEARGEDAQDEDESQPTPGA